MRHILPVSLILSLIVSSCHGWFGNRVRGNGNITTETRNANGFSGIDASAGIDVYLKQDSAESVKVEADANLQEYIVTDVDGGVLYIHPKRNISLDGRIKIYVSARNLKTIEASSAADIRGISKIQSNDDLFVKVSSSADVELDIKSPRVTGDISSAGSLKLTGETKDFSIEASSGSSAKCFDLMAENTEARVSSGASADVFASVKIYGRASSGGSIDYKGNASSTVETSSGGSVNKVN
jgi:hypothetical protein